MSSALRLELRRSRSLVLWVGLVSALYAGGITLFYPTVLENAAEFEKMLQIYPKELMAAFGLSGSLGDPGTFLNSYIFQFLWPLVAAIVAILMATRPAADAERGFLELPLSTRLSRLRYLTATIWSRRSSPWRPGGCHDPRGVARRPGIEPILRRSTGWCWVACMRWRWASRSRE